MSGNLNKKLRQYVRGMAPDMPNVEYAQINEHEKQFTFPPGTHIKPAADIVPVMSPPMSGHALPPSVVLVTTRQTVLDQCKRRAYKRLKTDVLRSKRNCPPVDWVMQDTLNVARQTR